MKRMRLEEKAGQIERKIASPNIMKQYFIGSILSGGGSVGVFKSILVGPFAALIVIIGNCMVILGLLPAHVTWTVYTLFKTKRFNSLLKVALLLTLPALFAIWVSLGIASSVLVGLGYGFLNPWILAFEAFRHEEATACQKLFHCVADGTWETITGSCTGVQDFADICYYSYPVYLKELRESTSLVDSYTSMYYCWNIGATC